MARTAVLRPAQAFAAPPASANCSTKRDFANQQLKGAGPIAFTHGLAAKHRTLMSARGLPAFPDEMLALPHVGASTAFGGGPLSRTWQLLSGSRRWVPENLIFLFDLSAVLY
jgi:hypothetical protein